nr:hypothetical protein BaRGS_018580 [Batillaria attramentaria]
MECAVCHEEYTDPKILPCAHLLCHNCLVSWLKTHDDAQCPLCRSAIVDPKERGAKSCEELAKALPTDVTMATLVDSARTLGKDHVCCVCDDVAATSICLECGDMFCQSCTKVHQKQSLSRHHTVEDLASMTAERLAASRPTPCATHTNEPSKLYCPTHGVSVCLLCATSKHRACPEVADLQEKADEARSVLGELATKLKEAEDELERAMAELDQHLEQTEKNTKTAVAEIETLCDRLQNSVEACRRRLTELAQQAKEDVKTAVHGGKTILLERRGKLTSHRRLVERTKQTAPPTSLDDVKTTLEARVKDLDSSVILPSEAKPITMPTLKLDQSVLSRLEKEIQQLGEIQVTPAAVMTQLRTTTMEEKGKEIYDEEFFGIAGEELPAPSYVLMDEFLTT